MSLGLPRTLVAALSVCIVACTGCGPKPARTDSDAKSSSAKEASSAPQEAEDQPGLGRISLKGTTLTGSDAKGNIVWRAEADTADWDEEAETAFLAGVECTFLEAGQPVSRYAAGKMTAHFSEARRRLHFSGNVRAESMVSPATAEFRQATYLWDEKRLTDARPVLLTRGATKITGDRLEADIGLRRVQVYGNPGRVSLLAE